MTRAPARAAAAYGHAAQAVPPLRQVVMLYDGAIRRITEAKLAIAEDRIED
jgi:flagellin-specific chaperone FliS